jgi:hypothetical protein
MVMTTVGGVRKSKELVVGVVVVVVGGGKELGRTPDLLRQVCKAAASPSKKDF